MTNLQTLLDHLQNKGFSVQKQPFALEGQIFQIQILTEDVPFDNHTLYLFTSHKLSKPLRLRIEEYAGKLYIIDCMKHPKLPFDAITFYEEADSSLVFQELHTCLIAETTLSYQIQSLYELSSKGGGLDALTKKAEEILERPISILDASYALMSVSPSMRQLTFGIDDSSDGLFLQIEEIESLRRLQIEDKIYQKNEAFFVDTEDHPDTNWIFCAIRINRVMSGYVAVCLPQGEIATSFQLRLTSTIAKICSVEMQKHDFFLEQTGLQYETFLTDLLEGRFSDLHRISSRLKLLNRHLGSYYCFALFNRLSPSGSDFYNKQQLDRLRKLFPGSMSIVYRNILVLFINSDQAIFLNEDFLAPIKEFATRNSFRVALSQPFADLLKAHIFFQQTLTTLSLSEQAPGDFLIGFSADAVPYTLFSKTNNSVLEAGIHYHLFYLQDYDATYHTEFVETLRTYLKENRNMAKAAEALHIHRSTFFYRIKKIEEILDISITDSSLLFLYEISFKIWDYLLHI